MALTLAKEKEVALSGWMAGIWRWMTGGIALTAAVAWLVAASPEISGLIFGNSLILIGLVVVQFALVIALSAGISKMNASTAGIMFLLYSALTGATLSSVFIVYDLGSVVTAFVTCSAMFAALSAYGMLTKRNLSAMGSFMFMGLIGLLVAMIVNMFLKSAVMEFVISCAGVLIFAGLTAWDTQKLQAMGENALAGDGEMARKLTVLGALTLYLDFINLFLMLLRFFGSGRD